MTVLTPNAYSMLQEHRGCGAETEAAQKGQSTIGVQVALQSQPTTAVPFAVTAQQPGVLANA